VKVEFTKSFVKTLKSQQPILRNEIDAKTHELIDALESGKRPHGLGIRKLKFSFWEMRVTLKTRLIFTIAKGTLRLLLVGTHNEVKNFLRSN
jgi:mRNA-degrading endonuclease RelE of RelBE toxin-antitoxin system